jgi:hypothetical protein
MKKPQYKDKAVEAFCQAFSD